MVADAQQTTEQPKEEHPAWYIYWEARRSWEILRDEAAKAHRRMENAADVLAAAGEMQRDGR